MTTGREDLEHWADVWDKAQKEGIFPEQPQIASADEEENAYWAYFDDQSKLMTEDHAGAPVSKADFADQARDMARGPNPVYHHTLGNDQDRDLTWTPNWIDGKELLDLADLKKDLYDLECQMNAKEANVESTVSIEKRIDSMKKKLHDLSNALTPDRFKEIMD